LELKFDLHIHTNASSDGVSSAQEMVEAAKARGLDGVAITDHDVIMNPQNASSLSERTGLIVIPGVEVSTSEGHLVILLPKRAIPAGISLSEAVRMAIEGGSVPFFPHPTDPLSHGVGQEAVLSLPYRLPIESLNASTLSRYNRSAEELANRLSLPKLASSDAHVSKAVGDAYSLVSVEERSLVAVLDAIRSGRTSPHGGRTSIGTALECYWLKLLRRTNLKKSG
jgi:predicted metal-dependent phosphoesterase TrpH